jgi:hypothetical protein
MGDCIPQTPCEERCERTKALELPAHFAVLSIAKEQTAPGRQAPLKLLNCLKSKGFRYRKVSSLRERKSLLLIGACVQIFLIKGPDSGADQLN